MLLLKQKVENILEELLMKQKSIMTIAMLLSGLFLFSACGAEKTVNVSAKVTVEQSSKKNADLSKEFLKNVIYAKLDVNSDGAYYVVLETLEKSNDQIQTQTIGVSEMKNGKASYRFAFAPEILTDKNNIQSFIGKWMMDIPALGEQDRFQSLNFLHQLPTEVANSNNSPSPYYPISQEKNASTVLKMNESILLYYISYQSPGPLDQTLTSVDDIKNSSVPYIYAVVLRITDTAPSDTLIQTTSTPTTSTATTEQPTTTNQSTTNATAEPTNSPTPATPEKTVAPTVQRQPNPTTTTPTTSDPNPTITPDQGVFMTNPPLFPTN